MSNSKKLNGKGGKVNTPTTPSTPASSSSSAPTPTVASPSTATFVPSLPDPSELVQGASLHITTSRGTAFDGTLFAYDAAAQLLIVEISYPFDDPRSYHDRPDSTSTKLELAAEAAVKGEGKKDFTILNAKQIRAELLSPSRSGAHALPPLSLPAIAAKVDANTAARQSDVQSIGIGVSAEAQKLFDAIRKTTPCVWSPDYTSFIVMDTVRVNSPFTSSTCESIPSNAHGKKASVASAASDVMLTRVRKMIEAERQKLKI